MTTADHWMSYGFVSDAIELGTALSLKEGSCRWPIEVWFCPLDSWLVPLSQGWSLPWIAEPMAGYHGTFAVLLERPALRPERDSGTTFALARNMETLT